MKRKYLTKSLAMTFGALGMIAVVSVVNIALAEPSTPEALQQSEPVSSPETQSTDIIDISIDANQDGVSDQLLAETQAFRAADRAAFERFKATPITDEEAFHAYSTAFDAASIQLEARMPFSDNARQIMTQSNQVLEQYVQYTNQHGESGPEQLAMEAELSQLSEKLNQDSSYLEVRDAQQKVEDFINMS